METNTTAPDTQRKDVYELINEKIITALTAGVIPWKKPWTDAGIPRNLLSKRPYRGMNLLLLAMIGYEQNLFLTFEQVQKIGAKVKRGEHGHLISYWKHTEKDQESQIEPEDNPEQKKKNLVLRYYYVFNVAQCKDIPEAYLPKEREVITLPSCQSVVDTMPNCPKIIHKEQEAYYQPKEDFINMPKKRSFKSDASYYATLFHEMVHSTGHEKRLNREGVMQSVKFGGDMYSKEELVAEIGTCYLQSLTGIASTEFEQSTAYIQGWLSKLQNDKKFIISASSQAQKATDYILGIENKEEDTKE
jgi:antirestriction protein ArdC